MDTLHLPQRASRRPSMSGLTRRLHTSPPTLAAIARRSQCSVCDATDWTRLRMLHTNEGSVRPSGVTRDAVPGRCPLSEGLLRLAVKPGHTRRTYRALASSHCPRPARFHDVHEGYRCSQGQGQGSVAAVQNNVLLLPSNRISSHIQALP